MGEFLKSTRNPESDIVMFLLSMKAGLRAKERGQQGWRFVERRAETGWAFEFSHDPALRGWQHRREAKTGGYGVVHF